MTESGTIGGALSVPALWRWAIALFKSPRAFFRDLGRKGGYLVPCVYLAAWSFASGIISFLVALLRPAPSVPGLGAAGGRAAQALGIFLGPLVVIAVAFVVAGVLFVIWHLMGSKEDYQTSFRCWAFMAPVSVVGAVLGVVPFLPVLVMVYTLYLVVVASEETHGLPPLRSWAVWGSLGATLLILVLITAVAGTAMRSRGSMPLGDAPSSFGMPRR